MNTKTHSRFIAAVVTLLLLGMTGFAQETETRTGLFQIDLIGPEEIAWDRQLNDGTDAMWYLYPQPGDPGTPPPLPWWNQWWWNDPYVRGGKWIQVSFDYKLLNPDLPGNVYITINWTNGGWVGEQTPPTWGNTPNPEEFIERLSDYGITWSFQLQPGSEPGTFDSGVYWLPIDYNPEWVSVDVQGAGNVGIWNGVLLHRCIPEPASLLLLAFGGWVMTRRKM